MSGVDSPRGDGQAGDRLATAVGAGGRQALESRGLLHSKRLQEGPRTSLQAEACGGVQTPLRVSAEGPSG